MAHVPGTDCGDNRMAESRPFLRSPFVTPDPNSGNWSSSHSSFSDDDDGEAQLYSTNDEKYGNSAEQFPDSVVEPQRPAKRSRARLILLVLLAIGVTVSISAWRAPDHVRTKAADMAHQVQHAASDQWKGAKEWSGWSSNPNTGGVGLDDPKVDLSIMDEDQPHPLYVLPDPPWDTSGYASERFLSYMPHSGYHNQRIELSNALSLAKMLNRTLLLPPVWIGWPVVTQPYSQLQSTWDKVMAAHTESFKERHNEHHRLHKRQSNDSQDKQLTEEECKSYAKECKSTYKDTFVAWRFLTNIEKARDRLSIVDRFNMTEAFAREKAGVQSDDDVYILEDYQKYYFHFHDANPSHPDMTAHYNMSDPSEDGMIQRLVDSKYWYTVSIPTLRERTADKKLLMVGSLHGTGRLRLDYESNIDNHAFFQRSLAFKNPVLDQPADHIRDLMGGPNGYAGVHARVGDGNFRRNSVNSMKQTYTNLLKRLGVKQHIIKDLATKGYEEASKMQAQQEKDSHNRKKMHKRSLHQQVKQSSDPTHSPWLPAADDTEDETRFSEVHLSNQLGRRQIATLLQPVQSREDMSLSSQMVCRGELHTNPDMQLLNNPVYIATDSRSPLDEPALQYFWNTLPCAFILSDFDRSGPQNTGEPVHELKVMQSAVNVNDDVKLGRLFLPFMEAMVAAKAVVTAGTAGSTFSAFAEGVLHEAYREGF